MIKGIVLIVNSKAYLITSSQNQSWFLYNAEFIFFSRHNANAMLAADKLTFWILLKKTSLADCLTFLGLLKPVLMISVACFEFWKCIECLFCSTSNYKQQSKKIVSRSKGNFDLKIWTSNNLFDKMKLRLRRKMSRTICWF